ncbi:hypothetical protein GWK47_003915 [Chionoecetes opilio]|uniref:Uncharacterized protein n=1 Tax=Chionoecetes opilio TaxID=41210 RepID=A0A8J4YI18_CHIOP|nr:hypothetical protein GWK47_003915 [Chionoecetes opilio]
MSIIYTTQNPLSRPSETHSHRQHSSPHPPLFFWPSDWLHVAAKYPQLVPSHVGPSCNEAVLNRALQNHRCPPQPLRLFCLALSNSLKISLHSHALSRSNMMPQSALSHLLPPGTLAATAYHPLPPRHPSPHTNGTDSTVSALGFLPALRKSARAAVGHHL